MNSLTNFIDVVKVFVSNIVFRNSNLIMRLLHKKQQIENDEIVQMKCCTNTSSIEKIQSSRADHVFQGHTGSFFRNP